MQALTMIMQVSMIVLSTLCVVNGLRAKTPVDGMTVSGRCLVSLINKVDVPA